MAKAAIAKPKRRSRPLYFSAKISDYQFKKVLRHFVLDDSAAEAARHISLSVNSISGIYAKLRKFFFEAGLFEDIYKGRDPRDGTGDPEDMVFEKKLIEFHMARDAAKRGLHETHEESHHLAESHWRFWYAVMTEGRSSDAIHSMMFAHLMEIVRCCGPVGKPPVRRREGLEIVLRQFEQRVAWMGRNSTFLSEPGARSNLSRIRDI